MPIVRVSGNDAESLSLDFAKMGSFRSSAAKNNRGGTTSNTSSYNNRNNQLSPTTPDTIEDLTSLDTSSGRTWNNNVDDTTDNNRLPYSRNNSSGSAARRRSSYSAEGGGSTPNSYYNSPSNTADGEKSLSPHRGGGRQQAYNINLPADNVDEMDNDPRNPFNPGKSLVTVGGWTPSDHIPEEDETSLSTLDEHSVTPSLSQQTSSRSNNNLNVHMQSQNNNTGRLSLRQQQQRQKQSNQQPQSIISDSDDGSISTHQSDFKRKNSSSRNNNNADKRLISQQTQIITQLELQVMKLNLDLATTKSSLNEIQLQNRKLQSDKDKLNETINSYQEENDQLHLLIERLEREKIIRNMNRTRGTIVSQQQRRPTDDSRVVWGHNSVSGHTWVADQLGDNDTTNQQQQGIYTVTQQKLGKVSGGLEVPFRTEPKRRSSVSSFNELSTVGGDDMSHAASCNSVALSSQEQVIDESDKLDISSCQGEEDRSISLEEAMGSNRSGGGLLNMFGVPKAKKEPQSQRDTTKKQTEDTYLSHLSPVHSMGDDDGDNDEYYTQSSGPSYHQQQETTTSERASDEPDMGSNPQGESLNDEDPFSTCDDEDPFATWSARGDPKREESEKPELNWLQRGLGGGRKRDEKKSVSRQPPQSQEENIEDPFSTCKPLDNDEEDGKYTSFIESDRDGNDSVISNSTNGPRRFGLFGRRRNS